MNVHGLTDLQQQLYDQLADDVAQATENMPDVTAEAECKELADSIKTMNAAELRHNIKVFKEC